MKYENILINTMSKDAHWQVNKAIAKEFGMDAAILLADLVSKFGYFSQRSMLVDGYFFNEGEKLEDTLCMGQVRLSNAFSKLEEAGLVKIEKRKGIPARNWYKIDPDNILNCLSELPESKVEYTSELKSVNKVTEISEQGNGNQLYNNKNKGIRIENKNKKGLGASTGVESPQSLEEEVAEEPVEKEANTTTATKPGKAKEKKPESTALTKQLLESWYLAYESVKKEKYILHNSDFGKNMALLKKMVPDLKRFTSAIMGLQTITDNDVADNAYKLFRVAIKDHWKMQDAATISKMYSTLGEVIQIVVEGVNKKRRSENKPEIIM